MTSLLPPSTANWHWRQKDVTPWARAWMQNQLVKTVFEEGKMSAKVDSIKSFEGDAEVGMRKSKLLTIYDLKIELKWSGTTADGDATDGTIMLPEVSHEVGADGDHDYHFETALDTESKGARDVYAALRKHLPAFLKNALEPFPGDMVAAHGKDLKVEGTPSVSGATTPVGSGSGTGAATPAAVAAGIKAAKAMNTSTIKLDATFAAPASDIFDLLTDEQKIPMWSRAPAKSKPVVDSEYAIFGGNIYGRYVDIQKPTKTVQSWHLKSPTWPDNHSATLTITLAQGSDTTSVVLELAGVPKGQEDELRNNLNGYYIQGFRSIGCVLVSLEQSTASSPPARENLPSPKPPKTPSSWLFATFLIVSVLVAAVASRIYSSPA